MTPSFSQTQERTDVGREWIVAVRLFIDHRGLEHPSIIPNAGTALGTLSPTTGRMFSRILSLECQQDGVSAGFCIDGLLADCVIQSIADDYQVGMATRIVQKTVSDWGLLDASEIAYLDARENIWRHTWPAKPPGPFERHFSKGPTQARKELMEAAQEELERIKAVLKSRSLTP